MTINEPIQRRAGSTARLGQQLAAAALTAQIDATIDAAGADDSGQAAMDAVPVSRAGGPPGQIRCDIPHKGDVTSG